MVRHETHQSFQQVSNFEQSLSQIGVLLFVDDTLCINECVNIYIYIERERERKAGALFQKKYRRCVHALLKFRLLMVYRLSRSLPLTLSLLTRNAPPSCSTFSGLALPGVYPAFTTLCATLIPTDRNMYLAPLLQPRARNVSSFLSSSIVPDDMNSISIRILRSPKRVGIK